MTTSELAVRLQNVMDNAADEARDLRESIQAARDERDALQHALNEANAAFRAADNERRHLREQIQALLQYVERIEAANRGHATAMSMLSNARPEQRRELTEAVEATRMGVLLETSLLLAAIKRMAVEL